MEQTSESFIYSAVQDVVSIAGLPAIPLDFYLITNQSSGFWDDPFDGVFGRHAHRTVGRIHMLTICAQGWATSLMGLSFKLLYNMDCPVSPALPNTLYGALADVKYATAVLGFSLTPKAVGGAELTIGGFDEAKIQGKKLVYIPIPKGAWVSSSIGIQLVSNISCT